MLITSFAKLVIKNRILINKKLKTKKEGMNMENMTMMTDLYELTMAQVYYNSGKKEEEAIFDVFFRKQPLELGYAIMGGIDRLIEYIENLGFT